MIEAPKWIKNPKADVRGWRDRQTGELLLAKRFTLEEVRAFEDARAAGLVKAVEDGVEATEGVTLLDVTMDGDELTARVDFDEGEFSTGDPSKGFTLADLTVDASAIENDPVAVAAAEILEDDDGTHIEAPVTAFMELDFDSMTKDELLALAEENNIEAFKSWSKAKIIAALT